jgi:hypothetical protein
MNIKFEIEFLGEAREFLATIDIKAREKLIFTELKFQSWV